MIVEIDTILIEPQLHLAIGRIKNPTTRKYIANAINYIGKQIKLKQKENEEMEQTFRKEKV